MRAAIYARVSTSNGQSTENQIAALRAAAERHGWHVVEEFEDEGISGAKGGDKRPAFDRMLKAAARREFDVLMAWSVDRLGRSLQDLVGFLAELHAKGVQLYLDRQGLDTTTPAGKALFGMLGVFAEFERAILRERTMAGLARARADGKVIGRPTISNQKRSAIVADLLAGRSLRSTAKAHAVGHSVIQRIKAELKAENRT